MNNDKCAEKHSFQSQYILTRCNKQSPQIGCHYKTKDIMNIMILKEKPILSWNHKLCNQMVCLLPRYNLSPRKKIETDV